MDKKTDNPDYFVESTFPGCPITCRGQQIRIHANTKATKFLYCNKKSVFIRDLKNPEITDVYNGHLANTTAATFAPSDEYVASADENGTVQIWTAFDDLPKKKDYEYKVLGGPVRDIAWDGDSTRLIAVGDGRNKFAHAFSMTTGASIGTMQDQIKCVNAVTIRQERPIRAATCSDDFSVAFYTGVPFKISKLHSDVHSRFVTSVSFSPDNQLLASSALDGKIVFYDALQGDIKSDIVGAHKSGIYSLAWSPDSKKILSSSGDGSAKLWDIETSQSIQTICIGKDIPSQQVSNLWAGDYVLSLSLSGIFNYLDLNTGSICRRLDGHMHGVSIARFIEPTSDIVSNFFSSDTDGRILHWDASATNINRISGISPSGGLIDCNIIKNDSNSVAIVVGVERDVAIIDLNKNIARSCGQVPNFPTSIAFLSNNPDDLISGENPKFYAGTETGLCIPGEEEVCKNIKAEIVSLTPDGTHLLCANSKSDMIDIYSVPISSSDSKPVRSIKTPFNGICKITFSKDGKLFAYGATKGSVGVMEYESGKRIAEWNIHSGRVQAIKFLPSSKYLVSGGIDGILMIYRIDSVRDRLLIQEAHSGAVKFIDVLDDTDNIV